MNRKWTEREYHVQDNAAVEHKDVIMYYNICQSPVLSFCGPHYKPHGAKGLSKHYHLCFDPKLGMSICAICRIPCACVACTLMLDKPWISGIKEHHKSGVFDQGKKKTIHGNKMDIQTVSCSG